MALSPTDGRLRANRPLTPRQEREREAAEREQAEATLDQRVGDERLPADDLVAEMAALFANAQKSRGLRQQDIEDAERILGRMDPLKYPELADSPVIQRFIDRLQERTQQNADIPPGTLVGTGIGQHKKIWQHRDVYDRMMVWIYGEAGENWAKRDPAFKPVPFIPMETITITWNGLSVTVIAGEEATIPQCMYEVFGEHNRALFTAEQVAQYLFRKRDRLDPKADASVLENAHIAHFRSMGQGTYFPGIGGFDVGEEALEEAAV